MPTGFWNIVVYLFQNNYASFLRGAGTTLLVAAVGTLVGCVIGFVVGIIKTIPVYRTDNIFKRIILKTVVFILNIYIEVFRGTPMMVQAMFIYYGAMQYMGIDMSIWFAGFFIVSINTGAYMSETVRGGILSIDSGQTEGAKAIGMNHYQTMLYIILPQALRNILPQIGNNLIINIKDVSVLSVISLTELFFSAKSVAGASYKYFESFFIISIIYLLMTIPCSRLLQFMEKKMDGADTYDLAARDQLAMTSGMQSYIDRGGDKDVRR